MESYFPMPEPGALDGTETHEDMPRLEHGSTKAEVSHKAKNGLCNTSFLIALVAKNIKCEAS